MKQIPPGWRWRLHPSLIGPDGSIYGWFENVYFNEDPDWDYIQIQDGLKWDAVNLNPNRLGSGANSIEGTYDLSVNREVLAMSSDGQRLLHLETTAEGWFTITDSHSEVSGKTFPDDGGGIFRPIVVNNAGRFAGHVYQSGDMFWGDEEKDLTPLGKGRVRAINNDHAILTWNHVENIPQVWRWESNEEEVFSYKTYGIRLADELQISDAVSMNDSNVIAGKVRRVLDEQGEPIPTAQQQTVPALLVPAELAVDANRDGTIKLSGEATTIAESDLTSQAKPFRFWINDDDDGNALNDEQEVYGGITWDYESRGDFGISSRRDLEDFARLRLYIGGLTEAVTAGILKIGLKWKEGTVTGSPAINLYQQVETDGGQKYLTDDTTAIAQTTPPYSSTLIDLTGKLVVDTSGIFILKPELFSNLSISTTTYFLFEGAGVGKGMLQMVILDQNNTIIGEGPGVWLDLQSILSMYQRVKVTPRDPNGIPKPYQSSTTFDADTTGTELSDDAHPFQAPSDETKSALVFVHGSNIPYGEAKWNAETMFKRLYWQGYGYKGRFVLFYWDTLIGVFNGEIPALPYDLNEYRALKYGPALKNYVATLSQGRTVNVTSHSLGAGVVLSALKAGMTVNNYLILQGAMSAKCYNVNLSTLQKFQDAESVSATPDLADQLGYGGYLSGVNGTVINMFNPDDYALATGTVFLYGDANWEENQRISKPDDPIGVGQYYWHAQAYYDIPQGGSVSYDLLDPARAVIDPHESMAFIARTRTKAVGAMSGVGGVISQEVNLGEGTIYDFKSSRADHSAEFTRRIQQVQAFYRIMFEEVR